MEGKRIGRPAALLLALAAAGCAAPQAGRPASASAGLACAAGATLQSPPGKAWWAANCWRFATDAEAADAYRLIAENPSPSAWPDWYRPYDSTLKPGTRFQMAIDSSQSEDTPGNWGTFDDVRSVADVRENLAVRSDWKKGALRVVTYEVVRELPVTIGPIGPQVDAGLCALLPGRWSQFKVRVASGTLRSYLEVLEVREIR